MKELNQKEMLELDGGGSDYFWHFYKSTTENQKIKSENSKLKETVRRFKLANGVTSKNSMQRTSY